MKIKYNNFYIIFHWIIFKIWLMLLLGYIFYQILINIYNTTSVQSYIQCVQLSECMWDITIISNLFYCAIVNKISHSIVFK